jgi:hypothetical protein
MYGVRVRAYFIMNLTFSPWKCLARWNPMKPNLVMFLSVQQVEISMIIIHHDLELWPWKSLGHWTLNQSKHKYWTWQVPIAMTLTFDLDQYGDKPRKKLIPCHLSQKRYIYFRSSNFRNHFQQDPLIWHKMYHFILKTVHKHGGRTWFHIGADQMWSNEKCDRIHTYNWGHQNHNQCFPDGNHKNLL